MINSCQEWIITVSNIFKMITIQIGDCRQLIKRVPDNSIDCIMTSPPYWGLRDYGHPDQIGIEPTPEEYLNTMMSLFDDIKLKLNSTGNCFVNLGDTYAGSGGAGGDYNNGGFRAGQPKFKQGKSQLKSKSLCMIPSRFAWKMIERGWILRNEIIWNKANHMPESVTDRLTKAHEVVYHFVKQQKYYYDLDSIREPLKESSIKRMSQDIDNQSGSYRGSVGKGNYKHNGPMKATCNPNGANPGDVWTINSKSYTGAHFAAFPIELVRRPILAGCPPGGHVLDPFGGSGTVAEFCRKNDRDCTIFELNPEYEILINERAMQNIPPLDQYYK